MTTEELTDLLGKVKDKYILEAETSKNCVNFKKKSGKKIILISAAAAALLLVGCAAAMVGLRDRVIGQETYEYPAGHNTAAETQSVISLFGYQGTPSYQAVQEWFQFLQTYDPEQKLLDENNMQGIPENYQITYSCYTQEMVDKVNEIAEKYGLKVMGTLELVQRGQEETLFNALGIDGLCSKNAKADTTFMGGYFYPEGAFKVDLDVTLAEEDALWPDRVWTRVFYTQKGNFDPKYLSLPGNPIEEWNYQTREGVQVQIAMDDAGAYIFAEQPDAYMTVSLSAETLLNANTDGHLSRQAMEQLADVYDFSITPHGPKDMEALKAELRAAEEKTAAEDVHEEVITYDKTKNYAEFLLDYNRWMDGNAYYALMDLNEDGKEELLLGSTEDTFQKVVTTVDGVLTDYLYASNGQLCEGQAVRVVSYDSYEISYYSFQGVYNIKDEMKLLDWLKYDQDSWYHGKEPYVEKAKQITKEEAETIINSYRVIPVKLQPILDFPVGDATLEEVSIQRSKALSEEQILEFYAKPIQRNREKGRVRYQYYMLRDITGDGIPELFAGSAPDITTDIFTIENGKLRTVSAWRSMQLYENNILGTLSTPPEAERYAFYAVKDGTLQWRETIEESRTSGKYFHSCAEAPLVKEEITKEEFKDIKASYGPVKMDMKPISEFPLP